ncbi:DUF2085 domain-containing protein [Natrinema ejinorense]|uniref:DUF2085 domain-containing protein n=1 Tax=Natrinema ejinorense TaxID=373386 RepID=A0A2A5QSQ4_9EURY|nr:DUF2085 domain-containing protein [Natrinema ejinorense]PCR89871.1 hypothetical protein CP557_04555 [Natrinema ejinorense]
MRIDTAELREGLAETRRFALAHHLPSERYRCYSPVLFGRRVHLCARCLGIYPGLLAGFLSQFLVLREANALLVVALFPLPALIDWAVTTFRDRRGYNGVRTATGALLGYGYGCGLSLVLFESNLTVLGIGGCYGIIAVVSIYYAW